ncbi:serine/threonine-protein kinase [Streptomyces sp. NPDC090106]|uniref:serine/threonine-protein kinase n=1 Tax=Streptomyces sp. NPDC090106 TaxID=3365946 RepID=UPI0037FAF6C2
MERLGAGDPPRIGAYRLLARLGAGGMGQVYLARSERGRTVAVKLVREELAAQEEFRDRFRQEVRAARQVGGYWTAPVLDADTEAAVPWVATGYVAGPSLQRVVGHDHGALPERSVRIMAAGLAGALEDIHAAGIVHRDLKPSNVLVTIDGPRVIDFGIARALETVTDGGLTRTGALVGSPGFMAPEQVRGDRITPACDVFCLGSVLAYAATGRLPFGTGGSGVHALMFRIAQEEPDLTGVPEGLADLVRDCLRKDPAARPSLAQVRARTGASDTVADGRSRDPWLPSALVAQLGRHAVRLLDTEDPEGAVDEETSPEHAPVAEDPSGVPVAAPPPQQPPTVPAAGHPPAQAPALAPTPVAHPAYGYPQQHPQPYPPHPQQQSWAPPPAYNPYGGGGPGVTQPYGPGAAPQPSGRSGRTTAALIAVALVVALGAGGSVYALMSSGDEDRGDGKGGGDRTPVASAPTTPGPTSPTPTPSPTPTTSAPAEGAVPEGYLGTWAASIDNADGHHTRQLTVQEGEVGDTVLSLVADGPDYHCVFQAALTEEPSAEGPLEIGPSTVSVGEPASSCSPGGASRITLLSDGTLERVNSGTGEKLAYTRQ